MVDWGLADTYYTWINQFKNAAAQGILPDGTQIMPAPYMEIKAANGTWIRAPQDRQIPLPSDYNARTFTVDLTGLFPADVNDCQVRFTNFWNVTYDYIGIDTSPNQNYNNTEANANFRCNESNVGHTIKLFRRIHTIRRRNSMIQNADDMFVIGRQGDQVNMQFSTANLNATEPGNGARLLLCGCLLV